jgi:uncharacterized membrane protein
MYGALIFVGAVLGVLLEHGLGAWIGVLVGAFAGYAVAELQALRQRGGELEKEVRGLKERLSALQREQRDLKQTAVGVDAGGANASGTDIAGDDAEDAHAGRSRPGSPQSSQGMSHSSGAPDATRASAYAPASAGISDVPYEYPILRVIREYFTSGNILVRVGILILFFGVAFLLRYAAEHTQVPVEFRLGGVALGGVALLALGWRLRMRRSGYALALQGGGIGILYLTTFAALRLYSLMPPGVGFAVLVFLAVFSAALAVLQDSQAFALLGVTGGFLAPLLASTGEGSYVVLFSYYAVLNASIFAIAWHKAWRPLNLAGFAFTFIISTAWGALHYNDDLFASTEPFLGLFFALYVAIAILFSVRQPPRLRGYVDGTLVFGTPMAAFGYQCGMLHHRPVAIAASAVVMGALYFTLAWLLHRQKRSSQRLLMEVFVALGVVFLTVAAPLALDSRESGTTWALEAAALVWIGARQSRVLPRLLGAVLQLVAAVLLWSDGSWSEGLWSDVSLFSGNAPAFGAFLARVVAAVAAVCSAVILRKFAQRLRSYEAASAPVLFFLGLAGWLGAGLVEIHRYIPNDYERSAALVFVAFTALACSELSRRTALGLARLPALWLLPALVVFAAVTSLAGDHPFALGGWLAWPIAFAGFYVICRRHEGAPDEWLSIWLQAVSAWLLVSLLSWELAWNVDRDVAGRGSWAAVSWMMVPASALFALPRLVDRVSWPVRVHRWAYVAFAGIGIAAYLALWSLGTNLTLSGDPYPLPYVPVLNALDLAQLFVLLVLWRFWLYLKSTHAPRAIAPGSSGGVPVAHGTAPVALLAALAFVWLNAALLRTLHRWSDVPLELDAVLHSTLVQTSLSIFWTILALATMLVATRRAHRGAWITGAVLLAVTILKLFAIDLSSVGTVERIVSFVGVGLLTLVIGYFSPLPPAATRHRTTVS